MDHLGRGQTQRRRPAGEVTVPIVVPETERPERIIRFAGLVCDEVDRIHEALHPSGDRLGLSVHDQSPPPSMGRVAHTRFPSPQPRTSQVKSDTAREDAPGRRDTRSPRDASQHAQQSRAHLDDRETRTAPSAQTGACRTSSVRSRPRWAGPHSGYARGQRRGFAFRVSSRAICGNQSPAAGSAVPRTGSMPAPGSAQRVHWPSDSPGIFTQR